MNTDQFSFASFHNRVKDGIYDPWTRFSYQAIDGIFLKGKKLEPRVYISKLKIVMDRDGAVVSIKTLKSCGVSELDEAAKRAFWITEPFPKPPRQMFGRNESMHEFIMEFHLQLQNTAFKIIPQI